jgi:hypothetical protein
MGVTGLSDKHANHYEIYDEITRCTKDDCVKYIAAIHLQLNVSLRTTLASRRAKPYSKYG